ncbi:hypothetical protein HZS_6054 [Henneguya salminicola]|nr:hypothetical protein HZS_6054 [Henneguya salminicola]
MDHHISWNQKNNQLIKWLKKIKINCENIDFEDSDFVDALNYMHEIYELIENNSKLKQNILKIKEIENCSKASKYEKILKRINLKETHESLDCVCLILSKLGLKKWDLTRFDIIQQLMNLNQNVTAHDIEVKKLNIEIRKIKKNTENVNAIKTIYQQYFDFPPIFIRLLLNSIQFSDINTNYIKDKKKDCEYLDLRKKKLSSYLVDGKNTVSFENNQIISDTCVLELNKQVESLLSEIAIYKSKISKYHNLPIDNKSVQSLIEQLKIDIKKVENEIGINITKGKN